MVFSFVGFLFVGGVGLEGFQGLEDTEGSGECAGGGEWREVVGLVA